MQNEKDFFGHIVDWGDARNLNKSGFDHRREISFIVEELLESTGSFDSKEARAPSLEIAEEILQHKVGTVDSHTIADSFGDIIVYAVGAITKLGYDPSKVMAEILKELNSRTGTIIDGKFVKDVDVQPYKADLTSCVISSDENYSN